MMSSEPSRQPSTMFASEQRAPAVPPRLRATPYPPIVGKALLGVARLGVLRWDEALRHVEREQQRVLRANLRHAADTELGRRHGFQGIRSYADFQRRVPVGDYDTFAPFIDRMRQGEQGLLVPEFVTWYGNSSGSSVQGKQKFLPITPRQVTQQKRAGSETLFRYLVKAREDSYSSGFTLGLFPPSTMRPEGKVLITSNPALMSTQMPRFVRPMYLPEEDLKAMTDYEQKLESIAARYLTWDIRAITGTTCWFSVFFEKVFEAAKRAGRPVETIREIWPNLRLLLGGGVSSEPYMPLLRRMMGREDVTLIDSYNATEGGIYAASDASSERGMLMIPHRGTFFEFVPMDDAGSTRRVPLWEVEQDRPYRIVVTTVSGLYAYDIGDIVRFVSTRPHRIEFMGRTAGCLSVTQELTTHVEIERAVAYAMERCPCRTLDYGAAADVSVGGTSKSRYTLYVEFDEAAEPARLDDFARAFDEGLCQQNRVYREHRNNDVAIAAPRVAPLVRGGAKQFLDKITRGNVQGKFPRILNEAREAALLGYVRPSPNPS